MRTWIRALLALAGAAGGMLVVVPAEILLIGLIGGDTEGTGLVAFGLVPFAAATGLGVGGWLAWRLTGRARPAGAPRPVDSPPRS